MSKPFHFKKFSIYHSVNAMKVSTDACVFGAVIAEYLSSQKNGLQVMDIGAGTGLLSCMVQQKNPSLLINAIEIEPSFCEEMKNNIQTCKFENHITISNCSLQEYISTQKYDVIFSNPPFFSNQMLSTNLKKRQVRHTILLTPEDIFIFAKNNLQTNGFLFLLLPYIDIDIWIKTAQQLGLFLHKRVNIKTKIDKPYSRVILGFTLDYNTISEEEIMYYQIGDTYTEEFKILLKDYYLFL